MIKLYGHPVSTCTRKVLTALKETKTPYEFVAIDLGKKEHKQEPHLSRQPFGQIPVLEEDGFQLYESRAICRYISAKNGDALTPRDVRQRALMDQWSSIEQSNFSSHAMKFVFHYTFGREQEPSVLDNALQQIEVALRAISKPLEKREYLAGNQFTIADIGFMPYIEYVMASPAKSTFEKYPPVIAWWNRVSARPTWREVAGKG